MSSAVGIIFPFYNQLQTLTKTLPALATLDPKIPICFIDNGSSDGTLDLVNSFIEAHQDQALSLIQNSIPQTLPSLWNQGLRFLHTPYLLLTRPTIELNQTAIDAMVALIETDPKIASVAPMTLTEAGIVQNTGVLYIRAMPTPADQYVPQDDERANTQHDFKSLRDTCLLIRRHGLFKEHFQLEHQDNDWTLTAYLDGYRNVYTPNAQVLTHEESPISYNKNVPDLSRFIEGLNGLEGADVFNDGGTYYGGKEGECNLPSTEVWQIKNEERKGRIMVFLADHDGCGTYRLKNPYRGLILKGWDVTFTTYAPDEFIAWGDVVVVQRACEDHMVTIVNKAKRMGKKVIYEIDDFFHGLEKSNPVVTGFYQNPHWLRNMEKIMYQSDALVVSTPELARQYGRFNTNTYIVGNYIDRGLIPNPILENNDGTVRIGWGGSGTHDADVPLVVSALKQVMQENDQVRMVFMGSDYRPMFAEAGIPWEKMEWLAATWGHEDVVADWYKVINKARIDIGVAPIADNHFNRCKSDIKLIEYGAYGIVPIASAVEPYKNFLAKNSGMGFLARSERDWYKYLTRLVQDPGLRLSMGRAIQDYVWHNCGVEHMSEQIEKIILDALSGNGHSPIKAEPIHSLNVPYLRNMTAKQATELMRRNGSKSLSAV